MNVIGWYSLYRKEILRFLAIYIQSFLTPVITAFLFLGITHLSLARANIKIEGIEFTVFLIPGLSAMSMAMTAFSNPSFSILLSKLQRNISSIIMAPISPLEFYSAYSLAAATRGMLTGVVVYLALSAITEYRLVSVFPLISGALLGSLMLGQLGFLAGLWAKKFEHLSAIMTFVISPLSLLSGGFFLQSQLPTSVQQVTIYNPFFYFIDLTRAGILGIQETSTSTAIFVLVFANTILGVIAYYATKKGYHLKN